jgi:hypothetical protein
MTKQVISFDTVHYKSIVSTDMYYTTAVTITFKVKHNKKIYTLTLGAQLYYSLYTQEYSFYFSLRNNETNSLFATAYAESVSYTNIIHTAITRLAQKAQSSKHPLVKTLLKSEKLLYDLEKTIAQCCVKCEGV